MTCDRLRNNLGQYSGPHPQTQEAQFRSEQQRQNAEENSTVAEHAYNGLLRTAMIVSDNDSDSLPAGMGEGPINYIAEKLFRPQFLLRRQKRCTSARRYYCRQNGIPEKRQEELPTIKVRGNVAGVVRSLQKPVFERRRLPRVLIRGGYESKKVYDWIDRELADGHLKIENRRDAFQVFINADERFRDVRSISNYRVRSVKPKSSPRVESSGVGSTMNDNVAIATAGTSGESEVTTLAADRISTESTDTRNVTDMSEGRNPGQSVQQIQALQVEHTIGFGGGEAAVDGTRSGAGTDLVQTVVGSASDSIFEQLVGCRGPRVELGTEPDILLAHTRAMMKLAANDKLFFILCKAADPKENCKLQLACAASVFMNEMQTEGLRCKGILVEVVIYAIGETFGVRNMQDHRARESRILYAAEMLQETRRLMRKTPYEGMDWDSVKLRSADRSRTQAAQGLVPRSGRS